MDNQPQTVSLRNPTIEVVDAHVGGDLRRIVVCGIKPLPGSSVLEQMQYLRGNGDWLRKIPLTEPR